MDFEDLSINSGTHTLVVGDSGTGKSTLASKLILSGFNLKWISTDGGHRVISKLPIDLVRKHINIIALPDTRDYPIASQTVELLFKGGPTNICAIHGLHDCNKPVCKSNPYTKWNFGELGEKDVVVLDHLSGVGDSYLNRITKGKAVDYKPQLDDWGSLRFHLQALGLNIQNAPYNILCLCHATMAEQEDKSRKIMPQVGSDSTSRMFAKYFDHVIYLSVRNGSHKAGSATTYEPNVITKSRSDIEIENMETISLVPFFDGTVGRPKSSSTEGAGSMEDKGNALSLLQQMRAGSK